MKTDAKRTLPRNEENAIKILERDGERGNLGCVKKTGLSFPFPGQSENEREKSVRSEN